MGKWRKHSNGDQGVKEKYATGRRAERKPLPYGPRCGAHVGWTWISR